MYVFDISYGLQLVTAMLGYAPNDRVIIALCGMGKVFVGEMIEKGEMIPKKPCIDIKATTSM